MGAEPVMRVLMTTDTIGGVWHYTAELAKALPRRGCHVTLASLGDLPNAAQRDQVARIAGTELHARAYRLEWMDEPWTDVDAAAEWLLDLAASVQPDLIHLNQFAFGNLPFDAPKLVVAHSSVTSWWRAVKGEPAPARWARYVASVRAGLAGADLVAAPTRAMLQSVQHEFGVAGNTLVLPNGRHAKDFPPLAKEPFIFGAGRLWDEAKNLAALSRVAASLSWPVVVAGATYGPDGMRCEGGHLRLLGQVAGDELSGWVGRAAIFAHPAYYEPFGLSVLEAALAGCALVVGDIASLREVWGAAALYVPPADKDALARTLQRLIDDAALRNQMAALARQRALHFSSESMVDGYLGAYRALIRRGSRSRGCVSCTL